VPLANRPGQPLSVRVLRRSRLELLGLTIRRAEVRKGIISIGLNQHMLDMIP